MANDAPHTADPRTNLILKSLSETELGRLMPHLEFLEMPRGKGVYYPGQQIDHVYFPGTAIISVVAYTLAGQSAEVGVIGRDGVAGHDVFLGGTSTPYEYVVQIPNGGWKLSVHAAKVEFDLRGAFHDSVLDFVRKMMLLISQTALCNRLHTAEQRLARWLLLCRDRSDRDVLELTQEFLAKMLGADRVTVSQAAGDLQSSGLIEYTRGRIVILDSERLAEASCSCYTPPPVQKQQPSGDPRLIRHRSLHAKK